jgi:hypothetical protein
LQSAIWETLVRWRSVTFFFLFSEECYIKRVWQLSHSLFLIISITIHSKYLFIFIKLHSFDIRYCTMIGSFDYLSFTDTFFTFLNLKRCINHAIRTYSGCIQIYLDIVHFCIVLWQHRTLIYAKSKSITCISSLKPFAQSSSSKFKRLCLILSTNEIFSTGNVLITM